MSTVNVGKNFNVPTTPAPKPPAGPKENTLPSPQGNKELPTGTFPNRTVGAVGTSPQQQLEAQKELNDKMHAIGKGPFTGKTTV